jgi:hypothetical protein
MQIEDEYVEGSRRAVEALGLAVDELAAIVPDEALIEGAIRRGHFRPDEEAVLLSWFARFLTIRTGLWEVLGDVSRAVGGSVHRVLDLGGWRCFVLGYTSACLIVRLDMLLLEEVARDSVTQRKLNEGSEVHRIPRKQYTAVFESFTNPGKAHSMDQAMRFARRHRKRPLGLLQPISKGGKRSWNQAVAGTCRASCPFSAMHSGVPVPPLVSKLCLLLSRRAAVWRRS